MENKYELTNPLNETIMVDIIVPWLSRLFMIGLRILLIVIPSSILAEITGVIHCILVIGDISLAIGELVEL